MKTVFKKGQTVYWGELKGEVVDIELGCLPLKIIFKGMHYYFTLTGRPGEGLPPVLSLTPYTLNGFSQEPQIEKDTLVYVRDHDDKKWEMRFYSHVDNGIHFCFSHQLKSSDTKKSINWKFVETENPLLK